MANDSIRVEITNPAMVDFVRGKVDGGEYASVEEVISEGLAVLRAEDADLETWLRGEASAACDEYGADPSSAVSLEQAEAHIERSRRIRPDVAS